MPDRKRRSSASRSSRSRKRFRMPSRPGGRRRCHPGSSIPMGTCYCNLRPHCRPHLRSSRCSMTLRFQSPCPSSGWSPRPCPSPRWIRSRPRSRLNRSRWRRSTRPPRLLPRHAAARVDPHMRPPPQPWRNRSEAIAPVGANGEEPPPPSTCVAASTAWPPKRRSRNAWRHPNAAVVFVPGSVPSLLGPWY